MNNAGEIMKTVRKERGFKLKQAVDGVCSPSLLSNFENGTGEKRPTIAFEKLYGILENIGVSLKEFDFLVNDQQLSPFERLVNEASKLYYTSNTDGLKQLLKKEQEKEVGLLSELTYLMLKNLISELDSEISLTQEEKGKISDYLVSIDHWGYYELTLYGNTMRAFGKNGIKHLSQEAIERSSFYADIPENRKLIARILINTTKVLIGEDDVEAAVSFQHAVRDFLSENDIFNRTVVLFLSGTLAYITGDREEGKQKMEDVIKIFKWVESFGLMEIYQRNYEAVIDYYK